MSSLFASLKAETYDPRLNEELADPGAFQEGCLQLIREALKANPPEPSQRDPDVIEAVSGMKHNLPQRVDMAALCAWEESRCGEPQHNPGALKNLIWMLDPKEVARRAGLDLLLWSALHTESFRFGARDHWHRRFLEHHGHSTGHLRVAAKAIPDLQERVGTTSAAFITYEFGQMLAEESQISSLRSNLTQFVKPGRELSVEQLGNFELEGVRIVEGYPRGRRHKFGEVGWDVKPGDTFHAFYLDAPVGLVLKNRDIPIAVAAGYADSSESFLLTQFQTIRPNLFVSDGEGREIESEGLSSNHWELEPLAWREFYTVTFAKLLRPLGCKQIGIQSAENNRWTEENEKGEMHLPLDRAQRIYNETAGKLQLSPAADENFRGSIDDLLEVGGGF